MSGIDLSIIILSYNTRELLKNCLESVSVSSRQAEKKIRSEVIVVDNASTDGSPLMVRKEFPAVLLIESKKNLGFAGGNNLGLRKAKGKYILFLNSDTEIYPQALQKAVEFIKKDKQIGAMTPKTILVSRRGGMDPDCHRGFPTPWASISYFLGLEKLFPKSRFFGQYHKFYLNLNENHEIDAGFGTFMIVRKEVIEKVGPWDDEYFFYGEDLDYFYRIKKAGYKVMFFAEPLLLHHKGASSGLRRESQKVASVSKETRIKTAKASIAAMEIFYRKFYKNTYPFWMTFIVLFGIKVKGFLRILSHYLK